MSEKHEINEEEVVCTHQLTVVFAQMEDGTVHWALVPDEAVGATRQLGLYGMAECGAPLAALGIRALWKLCQDGLIYHALEEANGAERAVARRQAAEPADLQLSLPMESAAVH
jgi:hypothetical protein